ncbi:MAG TPA: helix-turn-helix transcriptional regulator [Pseudonocardiaceae bacterium]|jgi:transcriptional regulator with XRE-family HTH domain|nr:helix-turn-helix transcriptional regulator [Pseudonocardiaceae bacterium]
MTEPELPTIRARELGAELKRHRETLEMTQEDVKEKTGFSMSKISRAEGGRRGVLIQDIATLLAVYDVIGKERDELLQLAKEADQSDALVRKGSTLDERRRTLIWLESHATSITNVETVVMPGLLQTGEYTRALMADSGLVPEDQIEDRMVTRLARHSVLHRQFPPKLTAFIDEPVLHRPVGGRDVQHRQLEHLLTMANWPTITIRVIPASVGVHAATNGSFSLLRFTGARPVVYVESLAAGLFLEEKPEITAYEKAMGLLEKSALDEEESARTIARLMFKLEPEEGTT